MLFPFSFLVLTGTVFWLLLVFLVKNGFSNLTKAQEGRDWPRKEVMNRHQKKALREGCRERKEARAVVSSRGKMNNK